MSEQSTLMTDAATNTEGSASTTSAPDASASQTANTGAQATGTEGTQTQQQSAEGQTNQTTDNKSDDGKAEGDQGNNSSEKPGAPEKYEFKAADGREFDADVLGQFSEVAKELNLTQEDAQKVIDKLAPALAEKQTKALETAKTQWGEAAKSDKEFGGDKLDQNLATAKKALDTFGTPELRALLNESGLGNHPEIIRAFYRAGQAISEDRFVSGNGGNGQGGAKDPAKSLYPNQQT